MASKDSSTPSQKFLLECFDYNPDTGVLRWKVRPREHFKKQCDFNTWNTKYAGTRVKYLASNGYLRVSINGKRHAAHRVIWLIMYNKLPKYELDHINHDRTDNRIVNLREVTARENKKNYSKRTDNTSGVTGVCWDKRRSKWLARIYINKNEKHIGYFVNIEEAITAVSNARKINAYHVNHGK